MLLEYEEGAYYLEPRKVRPPGFYEDYFGSNGDDAREAASQATVLEVLKDSLAVGDTHDQVILRSEIERVTASIARRRVRPRFIAD